MEGEKDKGWYGGPTNNKALFARAQPIRNTTVKSKFSKNSHPKIMHSGSSSPLWWNKGEYCITPHCMKHFTSFGALLVKGGQCDSEKFAVSRVLGNFLEKTRNSKRRDLEIRKFRESFLKLRKTCISRSLLVLSSSAMRPRM
jgi:hypothetical protein